MNLNFNDFQKQDIKFDVNKLQNAYKELLTIKGFSGVDGVSNFGAISLTQIPGAVSYTHLTLLTIYSV